MAIQSTSSVTRRLIDIDGAQVETFGRAVDSAAPAVCAAHPAAVFGAQTVEHLARVALGTVVGVNSRGLGGSTPAERVSLEQMVDDLEAVRRELALPRWVFWGMSGGGWLAQIYAHRHPDALAGIIVESACLCFRERLADPACFLSPFFPAWRGGLQDAGLLAEDSHAAPSTAEDTEWREVEGVGEVFRHRGGPALLVAPLPLEAEMKNAMPVLWTFDSRAWIRTVQVPALVVAGDRDPLVPVPHVRAIHEAVEGSAFVIVEGGTHVPSSQPHRKALDTISGWLRR